MLNKREAQKVDYKNCRFAKRKRRAENNFLVQNTLRIVKIIYLRRKCEYASLYSINFKNNQNAFKRFILLDTRQQYKMLLH